MPATPVTCIVADDHPAILDAVCRFLGDEPGIDLRGSSRDGTLALELIEQLRPRIAVLDVRMPGIDGIEIAVKLAASASHTSVILYTAEPARSVLLASVDAGIRGLVLKGSPLEHLARAVRVVADGGSHVDPALASVMVGSDVSARIPSLTKRERGVLRLLGEGMRDEQVGRTLSISPLTVRADVDHSMAKLGCTTRMQAVAALLG